MRSRRTDEKERFLTFLFLLSLAVFLFLTAYVKQRWDSDIFWALKSGEWIVRNFRVPTTDPFSYTFGGSEWVDFTWGFQATAHLFFRYLGGWYGLFILQLILTLLIFFFAYTNLNALTRRPWISSALLLLVFVNSVGRLFIRPHLAAYLFISLYLLLLNSHERTGRRRYLLMLLPLQVAWVNFHSSAILGIFIAGSYALGSLADAVRSDFRGGLRAWFGGERKILVPFSFVLPLMSLINPYGLKLAVFPFIHQGGVNSDALRHIAEWVKVPPSELFLHLSPFPLNHFAFKILLIGVGISLILNYRNFKTRDLVLLGGALYMATEHHRWVSQFGFFAAPILAGNISAYLDSKERDPRWALLAARGVNIFFTVIFAVKFLGPGAYANYGLGIKRGVFPEGTVEFMKKEGIRGNIYNEYIDGGYIMYTYPELKVFIDGRTPTVYSPYFFWTTRKAQDPVFWDRLVLENSITAALVKISTPLCGNLRKKEDWVPVIFDDVSVLYLRDTGPHKELLKRWGLKALNPCSDTPQYKLPEDRKKLTEMERELKRVIEALEGKGRHSRPHRLMGLVKSSLGKEEEAVSEFRTALSILGDPYTEYDLGKTLGKLKKLDEAAQAFKNSVRRDKGFKDGYLALGLAYTDAGRYGQAREWLEKYIYMADDRAEHISYKSLGMSCFHTGDFECAENSLKRAAFTTEDSKELANIYYYLGNSLLEQGKYGEGRKFYRTAIEREPEYQGVLTTLAEDMKKRGRGEKSTLILEFLKEYTQLKEDR